MSTMNPNLREKTISWRADVIADSSGKWVGDTLRVASQREVSSYLQDLTYRGAAVSYERVVESSDPINHRWTEHGLLPDAQISQR